MLISQTIFHKIPSFKLITNCFFDELLLTNSNDDFPVEVGSLPFENNYFDIHYNNTLYPPSISVSLIHVAISNLTISLFLHLIIR